MRVQILWWLKHVVRERRKTIALLIIAIKLTLNLAQISIHLTKVYLIYFCEISTNSLSAKFIISQSLATYFMKHVLIIGISDIDKKKRES